MLGVFALAIPVAAFLVLWSGAGEGLAAVIAMIPIGVTILIAAWRDWL